VEPRAAPGERARRDERERFADAAPLAHLHVTRNRLRGLRARERERFGIGIAHARREMAGGENPAVVVEQRQHVEPARAHQLARHRNERSGIALGRLLCGDFAQRIAGGDRVEGAHHLVAEGALLGLDRAHGSVEAVGELRFERAAHLAEHERPDGEQRQGGDEREREREAGGELQGRASGTSQASGRSAAFCSRAAPGPGTMASVTA